MIRCVIIDDEPFALDLIKGYVSRTPFLHLSAAFSNPFKALEYLTINRVDLILLDINMPELSGLQLYKSLVAPPGVIFTTAYPEFAAESYDYNAIDYLVKPIRYDRFLKAVNKASAFHRTVAGSEPVAEAAPVDQTLFLKSGTQQVIIQPSEILYVEAAGNYMCFYTPEKKVMVLLSMKEVLDLLPIDNFIRIHKSWIISLKHMEAIDAHDVVVGGLKIPIGITYREHFLSRIKR
jgi:two-component system, LytTR family, response regulator